MKPATRSAGTRAQPCAHYVRFTEAWNDRLHKAARSRSKTIQAFLHDAAIEAIEREEQGRQRARDEERAQKRERDSFYNGSDENEGMGIRAALRHRPTSRFSKPTVDEEVSQAPQITINTGSPPATEVSIAPLAVHVAKGGPNWKRAERREEALKIIKANTPDREECYALEKKLDDQVAVLTGEPRDFMSRIKAGFTG